MKKLPFLLIILLGFINISGAQPQLLRQKIEQIIQFKKAFVGVAVCGFENNDTLSINGNSRFPMQSVFKLHLALAVLNHCDERKLNLDQKIFIKRSDLALNSWSPLREKYPRGNINLPLKDILTYTVSQSDNTGCDLLFKLIGGTGEVEKYIHSIGIEDLAIKATEEEMGKEWSVQFSNWTTPLASIQLLRKIEQKKILSERSMEFLWEILLGSSTGKTRIKGGLPIGTQVAHKTGSSGRNENGICAAANDIGIVILPNGKHFAITVFVTDSKEDDEINEKIIADIAKATWDYFIEQNKAL